jgi:glycosyltransferase involved in cell wall biosynthesis
MRDQPLVTVVMPTWNRLPFVEEAVLSVVTQTYLHWELIVIDDGSTDGTAERLNGLRDSRIRVLSAPHIGHIGQLRNRGAAAGSGELIAFLDSDDVWMPQKLELQVDALRGSAAGWCYSQFELMDADGSLRPLPVDYFRPKSVEIVHELLTFKSTIRMPAVVVKRSVFDAVGRFSEDPRLLLGEDHELYLRLGLRTPVIVVPSALTRIREHEGRTSAVQNDPYEIMSHIYDLFIAYEPHGEHSQLARRLRARCVAYAGARQLSAGKFGRAALLFGRSLRQGVHVFDWTRALARGIYDGVFHKQRSTLNRNA